VTYAELEAEISAMFAELTSVAAERADAALTDAIHFVAVEARSIAMQYSDEYERIGAIIN
jgi:hypothetical protein